MSADIVGTHPYADKFPMLPDAELDELAESIAAVGLLHPIVVDPAGLILDGRNRLEACNRAQIEARVEVYEGSDVAEYVIACNVTRRNMTTGQRAMATALVLEADGRRETGRLDYRALKETLSESGHSLNRQRINEAFVVLDFKPDLAEPVVSGAVSLHDAFTQAEAIRTSAERDKILKREKAKREKAEAAADAERNAAIVADLTQAGAANYVDLIDAGTMTPKAAWAAYREDTRKERERADQERQGRSDLYTGIGQGLLTLGTYGAYEDIPALMAEYNPDELNPPQMARYFDIGNLELAARFTTELLEWSKNNVR